MRICGDKRGLQELGGPKERPQPHRVPRESVDPALLAVDDADGRSALETRLAQRLDGPDRGASRGDDVLDETGQRAGLEAALEPILSAVALDLLAHDHEGEPGGERRRCGEGDGAELGTGEESRGGLVLPHRGGDPPAELGEEVWPCLEAVLVQVVARAATRAEDEVALQVGM